MKQGAWIKSSKCESSHCVEVKTSGDVVMVRNSKTHVTTTFTVAEWRAFVSGAREGEFDV